MRRLIITMAMIICLSGTVKGAQEPPYWVVNPTNDPNPVYTGMQIRFNVTADDINENKYKLYVCKSDWIIGGAPGGTYGSCGVNWCESSTTNPGEQATCNYTTLESDVGTHVAYIFACDSSGRCNNETERFLNTTVKINYGWLNVTITAPVNKTIYNYSDTNLTISASVQCEGNIGAKCAAVYAYARYNLSGAKPDTNIPVTIGATPFYLLPYIIKNYNYTSKSMSVTGQGLTPTGMDWKPDGTRLYHTDYTNSVFQRQCTTAWDISTCTYTNDKLPPSVCNNHYGGSWSTSTTYIEACVTSDTLIQYNCTQAWNISTCAYGCNISSNDDVPTDASFYNANRLIEQGYTYTTQYDCPNSYELCGCTYNANMTNNAATQYTSWTFTDKGRKALQTSDGSDALIEYNCSTAGDVTTCKNVSRRPSPGIRPTHLTTNPNGNKLYYIGFSVDKVMEYALVPYKYATLLRKQNANYTWQFNITSLTNQSIWLDVNFTSTLSPNITDNHTKDLLINLTYDVIAAADPCVPIAGVDWTCNLVCLWNTKDYTCRNLIIGSLCNLTMQNSNLTYSNHTYSYGGNVSLDATSHFIT